MDDDNASSATDEDPDAPPAVVSGKMAPATSAANAASAADADFGRAVMIGSRATAAWAAHIGEGGADAKGGDNGDDAGDGGGAATATATASAAAAAASSPAPAPGGDGADRADALAASTVSSRATSALARHLAAVLQRVASALPSHALPQLEEGDGASHGDDGDEARAVTAAHGNRPPTAGEIKRLIAYPHVSLLHAAAAHQAQQLSEKTSAAYAAEATLVDADAALAHWRLQLEHEAESLRYLLDAGREGACGGASEAVATGDAGPG